MVLLAYIITGLASLLALANFGISAYLIFTSFLLLHFAWVEDHEKCIVVTRAVCVGVCVCVCLCVRGRMPTVLHGPGCNLGQW